MLVFAPKAITASGDRLTGSYLLRMLVICVSYANLCFLNVWAEVSDRGYDFLRRQGVGWQKVAAVTLDILIVAVAIWSILYLALASGRRLWIRAVKWIAIIGLAVPVNVIRTDEKFASLQKLYVSSAPGWHLVVVLLGAGTAIFLLINWERLSTRITTVVLIVMAPSMPLCAANAAWRVWTGPQHGIFPDKALQPALAQPAGAPHVIWILFDEWDNALTFRRRPATLRLPEIDRFQGESFHAERVYPPARITMLSVPSLLTGKTFIDSRPQPPNEIMLTYERGQPALPLTAQRTIFSDARRDGHNVGIVGWYLPYCRLFPEATACSWFSAIGLSGREEFDHPASLGYLMGEIFEIQVRKIPFLHYLGVDLEGTLRATLHEESYRNVKSEMLRMITDPRLNLIYVHMGLPHLPGISPVSSDAGTNTSEATYLDNLRLLDTTIRDLRRTLESAGMWDNSVILLTADHPLRVSDQSSGSGEMTTGVPAVQEAEVPYLLKMPGQKQGFGYDRPVQEVVTKRLLLAILSRSVNTPDQVAAWLDSNPPRE